MRTFLLSLFVLGLVAGVGYAAWILVPPELERWRQADLARQRQAFLDSQFPMKGGLMQERAGGIARNQWLTDDERYYVMLAGSGYLADMDKARMETPPKRWGQQSRVDVTGGKRYTVAQWIAEGRDYEKAQADLAGVPVAPGHFPIAVSGVLINPVPGHPELNDEDRNLPTGPFLKVWFGNPLGKPITRVHGRATVYDNEWGELGTTEVALADGLPAWETKSTAVEVDLSRVRSGQAGPPHAVTFVWTRIDFADGTSFVATQ